MDKTSEVESESSLYIFSDGVYEIQEPDGQIWGLDPFINLLSTYNDSQTDVLDRVLDYVMILNAKNNKTAFDDDWSLIKVDLG
jgi:sigma-B regulation protein RsbU (phosphoserine phosphatase)